MLQNGPSFWRKEKHIRRFEKQYRVLACLDLLQVEVIMRVGRVTLVSLLDVGQTLSCRVQELGNDTRTNLR